MFIDHTDLGSSFWQPGSLVDSPKSVFIEQVVEMSLPQRTSSTDSTADSIRKRVCKACDRCRMKKSKCDGASPCSRCTQDNSICAFGERKKSHDKVYPKGYVEVLEQQHAQLITALQTMYRRSLNGQPWTGPVLNEPNGHPLTHDILKALNLLEPKHNGSGDVEMFEEDCDQVQSKLIASGASFVRRRGSISSESERSHHAHSKPKTTPTPIRTRPPIFKENFSMSATPSPITQSPMQRQRQTYPPTAQSPLHRDSLMDEDQDHPNYRPTLTLADLQADTQRSLQYNMALTAMQTPQFQDNLWNDSPSQYDFGVNGFNPYPQQTSGIYPGMLSDLNDMEFARYIDVQP